MFKYILFIKKTNPPLLTKNWLCIRNFLNFWFKGNNSSTFLLFWNRKIFIFIGILGVTWPYQTSTGQIDNNENVCKCAVIIHYAFYHLASIRSIQFTLYLQLQLQVSQCLLKRKSGIITLKNIISRLHFTLIENNWFQLKFFFSKFKP